MPNYDIDTLTADRSCPIYQKDICCELCYETVQVLDGLIKSTSVPELNNVDIESSKVQCQRCKHYSTWEENY